MKQINILQSVEYYMKQDYSYEKAEHMAHIEYFGYDADDDDT